MASAFLPNNIVISPIIKFFAVKKPEYSLQCQEKPGTENCLAPVESEIKS
jgi:hypothetical protein